MRRFLAIIILSLISGGLVAGQNRWRIDAGASFSTERESARLFDGANFLRQDRAVYRFGFNRTLAAGVRRAEESDLGSNFLGGSYHLFPSSLAGRLNVSLDTHFLSSPVEDEEAGFRVISPQVTYMSHNRKLYMDLGYAVSRYEATKLTVHQLTPTFGFTLNNRDWFQVRGYFIDPRAMDNDARSLYTAAEGSWIHRFSTANLLGLSRLKARATLGRRVYTVDQDLKIVHSEQNEQSGSISFSLHWSLPYKWDLMFQNSIEEYYTPEAENQYRLNYGFLGIERRW